MRIGKAVRPEVIYEGNAAEVTRDDKRNAACHGTNGSVFNVFLVAGFMNAPNLSLLRNVG